MRTFLCLSAPVTLMRRIAAILFLSLSLLLVASAASAEVTRLSFEALDSRDVRVELRSGERVEGELRVVAEEAVVLLTDDGEIRELRYSEIAKLRVARVAADARAPTEQPATPTSPRDETRTAAPAEPQTSTTAEAPRLTGSSGYIPDDAVTADAHARAAAVAAAEARERAHADELILNEQDYLRYRSMVSSARVKRIIGWSIASAGALVLVGTLAEKIDAERWGRSYDGRSSAAAGFILGGIATPLIIWGRSQHKRADRFAEAAAVRRPTPAQLTQGRPVTAFSASASSASATSAASGAHATRASASDAQPRNTTAASGQSPPVAGDGPYDQPQAIRRTLIEPAPPPEPLHHAPADTATTRVGDATSDDAPADEAATATSEDDAEDVAPAIDASGEDTANGDAPTSSNDEG